MSLEMNELPRVRARRPRRPDRPRHLRRVRLPPRGVRHRRRGPVVPLRSPWRARRARLPAGVHRGRPRPDRAGDPRRLKVPRETSRELASRCAAGLRPSGAEPLPAGRERGRRLRLGQPARGGCPSPTSMSGGSSTHFSKASGQRVRNRQPDGIAAASGVSPTRIVRFARSPGAGGSGDGATDTSAAVYGWRGAEITRSAGPISMILPRYMTATRSAITHASDRSWVMNR